MNIRKSGAFTAFELLVVILIILSLAALGVSAYNGLRNRGKKAKAGADIDKIEMFAEMYRTENGVYPLSWNELKNFEGFPPECITDPWGNAYAYTLDNGVIGITSAGPDGIKGNADDIKNTDAL